jgi:hypothetical protein
MNREQLTKILADIDALPEALYRARQMENGARMARDEAKENLDIAVTNALISGNGQAEGKNAEERKLKSDAYLSKHPEVIGAKKELRQAEADLLDAQIERMKLEDVFAVQRAILRAIGSYLDYLAGAPRQTTTKGK